MIADRTCRTCACHDSFSWVCFNGDSPYCADFTQNEQKCPEWEQKAQKEYIGVEEFCSTNEAERLAEQTIKYAERVKAKGRRTS